MRREIKEISVSKSDFDQNPNYWISASSPDQVVVVYDNNKVIAAFGGTMCQEADPLFSLIRMLAEIGLRPDRIVPCDDSSVYFYFFGRNILPGGAHQRYASIVITDVYNTTYTASLIDRKSNQARTFEIKSENIHDAICAIAQFIKDA